LGDQSSLLQTWIACVLSGARPRNRGYFFYNFYSSPRICLGGVPWPRGCQLVWDRPQKPGVRRVLVLYRVKDLLFQVLKMLTKWTQFTRLETRTEEPFVCASAKVIQTYRIQSKGLKQAILNSV